MPLDAQRLETALRAADAAGDTEAAQKLAGALKNMRSSSAGLQGSGGAIEPSAPAQDISTRATRELPELFTSGILKGKDPAKIAQFTALAALTPNEQELGQIATSIFPEIGMQTDEKGNVLLADNQTGVRTVINRPGLSSTDLAQLFGIGGAFTPAARVGTGIVTQGVKQGIIQAAKGGLASGATQAAIEGAQAASGGEFDAGDIALAAGMQPGVQALGESALVPAARMVQGQPSKQAQQVIEAGKRANVPVMTSDVVPPQGIIGGLTRQFAERIPFLGTGGVRAKQNVARQDAVQNWAAQIPQTDDRAIIESLKAKKDKIRSAAGERYERIKADLDKAGPVPLTNTMRQIDDTIANLSAPGKVPDESTIRDLLELKKALQHEQNFSLLRENRTYLSDLINGADPAGRSQIPTNTKRLLTRIKGSMSQDMDDFVKSKTPDQFFKYKHADEIWAEESRILSKSRLKNVLDKGDVTPEQYRTLMFSSKPSEVELLYRSLDNNGRAHGRNAILNHVVEKAGGLDNMTPETINREIKKAMPQIEVFFKGSQKEQLKGFQKLLEATKRASEAKAVTPTGQSLQAGLGVAAGAGLALQNPAAIIGAMLTGGLALGARAYESAPVRKLMIRLANAQKGSKAEQAIINNLLTEISAASQVTETPAATSAASSNF